MPTNYPELYEQAIRGWAKRGREIERLKAELDGARVQLETQLLGLEAVAWYFAQRRYSVSPTGDGTYYLHDMEGERYPKLIKQGDGSWWPSVYMALVKARECAKEEK